MILRCQDAAILELKQCADSKRHSILIEGPAGCGKSYLAAYYGKLLDIHDIVSINSTVADLRTMLENCYSVDTPVVVCIEGLDSGQLSSSYVMLKFLEEPRSNIYIVITCSNRYRIPDTIVSRSVVVTVGHPTRQELTDYLTVKYPDKVNLTTMSIYSALMSFKDIDDIVKLSSEHLSYYQSITNLSRNDSVSNLSWKLGHYDNNEESNLRFVFRCILNTTTNPEIKKLCISTLNELEYRRMSSHAVLAKFAFDFKYGV